MPANQGPEPKAGFGNTNSSLRKEIANDLLSQLTDISGLMRTADSIVISDHFHLDSRELQDGSFKVDVQYRKGTKATVAQIQLAPTATSLADAQEGINNSAADGHIWIVT
jgi:hypothetical protein